MILQLLHTGEVMVYLGDSWFVNRTVNQGLYQTSCTVHNTELYHLIHFFYFDENYLILSIPLVPRQLTGIEIAERRRERIQKELGEYKLCLDNIENKLDMTSELEDGIVEELTEEDIKRSKQHLKFYLNLCFLFVLDLRIFVLILKMG